MQVIQSWYVMGRLGAFNSSNMQVGILPYIDILFYNFSDIYGHQSSKEQINMLIWAQDKLKLEFKEHNMANLLSCQYQIGVCVCVKLKTG